MPAKLFKPRIYQKEAIDAITEELITNGSNKCLVKMFCGTGKSLIMRTCDVCQNVNLLVYVFPSLSLISQFAKDYLNNEPQNNILKISSDNDGDSTTNSHDIVNFLSQRNNKIICITYQSFNTLIDNLGDTIIDVCVFDEAHHAVGQTYQQYIFKDNSHSLKQIFFTATPKNDNGIIMYEKDVISDCGKMVYDYTYYRGIIEGHLNPFEIRLDFYTEHNNHSIYESICRSILASGNNRVLTFHSDVNTDRDTSVNNFVNQLDLDQAFNKVLNEEFPEKIGYYSKINILGLSSSIVATCRQCLDKMKNSIHRPTSKHCCRYNILDKFDKTKDNEILIISSCETIGEGIDTKNANMCVFVDPKGAHVSIMQNIGRIVRRNEDRPISTILIPCWVDREKYLNCNGDKEKCDEAIRADLGDQGNFNQILNVLSALKQEDEELYDICLNYPDAYSPQEIYTNLKNQGFEIKDMIGEGQLIENIEYLLDEELDYENYEDCDTDEEMLARIADEYRVNVEVHTNSLDNPIEKYVYSVDDDDLEDTLEKKTIRLYKTIDEDTEETIYSPIVEKASSGLEKKQSSKEVHAPDKTKRMNLKVHTNPDIKVLWNITDDMCVLKNVCSCVIDCEVVDNWYERFEELKQFIDENKRRPCGTSKDKYEKMLGCWCRYQVTNYEKNIYSMKNEKKYDSWTYFLEEYKEYFKSDDEKWYEKFEKLKEFIDEFNRRPRSDSKNIHEKKIGGWMSRQNDNYKNKNKNMNDKIKYNLWKQFLEEYDKYFKSVDELWYENFDELTKFINAYKKRPSVNTIDNLESTLGRWVNTQKHNFKNKKNSMKDIDKYDLWTQFLEDYKDYFKLPDEIWYEKFTEAKQFMNDNQFRPSHASKNKCEKEIGCWVHHQNNNYKNKINSMKDTEKYHLWTQFLKDYEEYFKSNDEIWYGRFDSLKIFINSHKKCPVAETMNNNEKTLGYWLQNQKNDYKNKNKNMNDEKKYNLWKQFLKDYEEYFKSNDEIWYEKIYELQKYIDENNKTPNMKTPLGAWINTQNNNYKHKKQALSDPKKYESWKQFLKDYKKYFKTKDNVWYEKFDESKEFMSKNNKKPSRSSKNNEEKQLGSWINIQNNNYKHKKQALADPEKYKLWTKFLFDNRNILNLREDIIDYSVSINDVSEENSICEIIADDEPDSEDEIIVFEDDDDEDEIIVFEDDVIFEPISEPVVKKSATLQRQKVWQPKQNGEDTQQQTTNTQQSISSTSQIRHQRSECDLTQYHRKYLTMRSNNLGQHFKSNRDEFIEYHRVRNENLKAFELCDQPHMRIIAELDKIKTKRRKHVVDMGCGLARIAEHFKDDTRFQFINYDHVSTSENITECDISQMPLEDNSIEICIMSMAMWGSNCNEYITEAYRVLESGMKLYIIDSTKRWSNANEETGIIEKGSEGNRLKNILVENGFQIINKERHHDKWCLFECIKK
jgi:superfamily II DNA or RNA helicase